MSEFLGAIRLFWRQSAFSATVVALLATGIGAATTVYSIVHRVLIASLPFREPDRLVWMYNLRAERDRAPLSIPDLVDYLRDTQALSGLEGVRGGRGVRADDRQEDREQEGHPRILFGNRGETAEEGRGSGPGRIPESGNSVIPSEARDPGLDSDHRLSSALVAALLGMTSEARLTGRATF